MGFDSGDLCRLRSGLALSEVCQHRVEVFGATVASKTNYEQARSACEKFGLEMFLDTAGTRGNNMPAAPGQGESRTNLFGNGSISAGLGEVKGGWEAVFHVMSRHFF